MRTKLDFVTLFLSLLFMLLHVRHKPIKNIYSFPAIVLLKFLWSVDHSYMV